MRTFLIAAMLLASGAAWGQVPLGVEYQCKAVHATGSKCAGSENVLCVGDAMQCEARPLTAKEAMSVISHDGAISMFNDGWGGGDGNGKVLGQSITAECPPICISPAPSPPAKQQPRAYTLGEIDRMRVAISDGPLFKEWAPDLARKHRDDYRERYAAIVEDRLRTYMAAGISPEELEAKVGK